MNPLTTPVGKLAMFSVVLSVQQGVHSYFYGIAQPELGHLVWRLTMPLFLVHWIYNDHKRTRYWPCFEYDAFTFWAWPLTLPYYLVHTRGRRGILLFIGMFSAVVAPGIAYGLGNFLRTGTKGLL
jgi:hypothetical protein